MVGGYMAGDKEVVEHTHRVVDKLVRSKKSKRGGLHRLIHFPIPSLRPSFVQPLRHSHMVPSRERRRVCVASPHPSKMGGDEGVKPAWLGLASIRKGGLLSCATVTVMIYLKCVVS